LFELFDSDKDDSLTLNELAVMLQEIGSKITALPAVSLRNPFTPSLNSHFPQTAQVASQQGKYLGKKLHKLSKQHDTLIKNGLFDEADEFVARPFKYFHMGSLAYIGNAAVFDFGGASFMGGLVRACNLHVSLLWLTRVQWAMYAWRSIYFSEQVGTRTRALLMIDWIIRGIWGRDLSRL
jgi:NADH dehydrogenase FAD-containing subunit